MSSNICKFCDKSFSTRGSCVKHEIKFHNNDSSSCKKLLCSECQSFLPTRKRFDDHIRTVHPDIILNIENLAFESKDDFDNWLSDVSKSTTSKYIVAENYKTKSSRVLIYSCHRSGDMKSTSKGIRHIKMKGSYKTGYYCPARIRVEIKDSRYYVLYNATHIGHQCESGRLPLTKDEKDSLAGQLLAGVPHQNILCKISSTVSPSKRLASTTAQDLRNISKQYGINMDVVRSSNDALSVESWVKEMKASDENPILLYKAYGEVDVNMPSILAEDFILAFMNDAQEQLFKIYGSEVISIDSTHGTNQYNIQLTSIIVKDDNWEGFPVAFLWSNRQTEDVFRIFFKSIFERIGHLQVKTFMSDDFPAFYNAWSSVFKQCKFRLLCDWHVKRAWAKNASSGSHAIKNLEVRENVLSLLRSLSNEVDERTFKNLLSKFLELQTNDEAKDFMLYFQRNYCSRVEQWAACFRVEANVNTNMSVERWHKDIKYNSDLKGKCGGRLDKAIHSLMKSLRLKLMARLVSLNRGKLTKKISTIRNSHRTAVDNFDSIDIFQINEHVWIVPSFTQFGETYKVHRLPIDTSHKCNLNCELCETCLHEYRCNCPESSIKFNFCKHIHILCLKNSSFKIADEKKTSEIEPVLHLDVNPQLESINAEKEAIGNAFREQKFSNMKEEARAAWLGMLPIIDDCVTEDQMKEIIKTANTLKRKLQAMGGTEKLFPPIVAPNSSNKNIQPQRQLPPTKRKGKLVK